MGYWTYSCKKGGRQTIFYTEQRNMRVTDFVKKIKEQYHVNALRRDVGKSDSVPRPNTGGRAIYIQANSISLGNVLDDISVEPEFCEKLSQKLKTNGTLDGILDSIIEVGDEFGIDLTMDELKEAVEAEVDENTRGGAVIVYGNYLIIS